MSYEILKKIKMDKQEGKIVLTTASNNVYPRNYGVWEYDAKETDMREKVKKLSVSLMDGNIQPLKSAGRIHEIWINSQNLYSDAENGHDLLMMDFNYGTKFCRQVQELIADNYAVPALLGEVYNMQAIKEKLKNLSLEIETTYNAKVAEFQKGKIIIIHAAIKSSIYPEYDVLIAEEGVYLAPQKNYDNKGHLDNSADDAIFLGKEPERMLFNMLGSGLGHTKEEYQKILLQFLKEDVVAEKMKEIEQVDAIICEKLSALSMNKLPYGDFPYQNMGTKVAS